MHVLELAAYIHDALIKSAAGLRANHQKIQNVGQRQSDLFVTPADQPSQNKGWKKVPDSSASDWQDDAEHRIRHLIPKEYRGDDQNGCENDFCAVIHRDSRFRSEPGRK